MSENCLTAKVDPAQLRGLVGEIHSLLARVAALDVVQVQSDLVTLSDVVYALNTRVETLEAAAGIEVEGAELTAAGGRTPEDSYREFMERRRRRRAGGA